MKYILITGGVISGVGKGIIASSIGRILKECGINVTLIKIDPYINIDAGTFSPYEHGEVFVLEDGSEVDLDLGNYERFLDVTLRKDNNITTGKVYQRVINEERQGKYLGKTVQVVPHITNAIQEWVLQVASRSVTEDGAQPEVCIIELGGTIGDIEGMPFVEAFRQFQFRVKKQNFFLLHVSLILQPRATGEQKTKPTQSSVRELRGLGLSPDMIVCRSEAILSDSVKDKISNFCHVEPEEVISVPDVSSIYKVPILMVQQGVLKLLLKKLQLKPKIDSSHFMKQWNELTERAENTRAQIQIALVGKYTKLEDAYKSVYRALQHASLYAGYNLKLSYIEASDLERATEITDPVRYHNAWKHLCSSRGVVVPGGFDRRGLDGKISACKWCREQKVPLLGICLGLQASVIEFSRNVVGLKEADTTEGLSAEDESSVDKNSEKSLIYEMLEFKSDNKGGTMRLGKRSTVFVDKYKDSSIIHTLYGKPDEIHERHRHRYEVNLKFREAIENNGLKFVGTDEAGKRMEIAELDNHPFYVATQFHPEYSSRPLRPSPVFLGLILAACGKLLTYVDNMDKIKERDEYGLCDNRENLLYSDFASMLQTS